MHEQTVNMVTPFLDTKRLFLQRTLPDFLALLQSYLDHPAADVTGLKLFTRSDQAREFQRTFGEMASLLAKLDDPEHARRSVQPLEQDAQLADDYRAQAGDYSLVSVYTGRSVVQSYDGHSWKYVSEIPMLEAQNVVASLIPLGKKGGFLFYRSAQDEQEYQYPEQQSRSHMIREEGENKG